MKKRKYTKEDIKESITLYLIASPLIIMVFVFCYLTMYGIVIAFQDYVPGRPILSFDGSIEWVGLEHFIHFIEGNYFGRLIRNTIVLNVLNLIFGFWTPIVFALLLNELKCLKYKKTIQTVSYMPYFISTVIVAGMAISVLEKEGLINQVLALLGMEPISFLYIPNAFPAIYTAINVWKSFGFSNILYLSTLSSISPELYESADIDGAGRMQKMLHISLPGMKNIIAISLIMSMGGILSANSELILLLYNPSIYSTADVIGTYTYRLGILGGQFSYTTAVGLFMSLIGFIMTVVANKISSKVADYSLW